MKIRQPHCCLVNELFSYSNPHFDGWKAITNLFTTKFADKQFLKQSMLAVSQDTSHLAQTDFPFVFPLELKLAMMTSSWSQMLNPAKNVHNASNLIKLFLIKNDVINGAFRTELEKVEQTGDLKFEHK